jgi:hypothetical protein
MESKQPVLYKKTHTHMKLKLGIGTTRDRHEKNNTTISCNVLVCIIKCSPVTTEIVSCPEKMSQTAAFRQAAVPGE